jgi:hypothetical protein
LEPGVEQVDIAADGDLLICSAITVRSRLIADPRSPSRHPVPTVPHGLSAGARDFRLFLCDLRHRSSSSVCVAARAFSACRRATRPCSSAR